MAQATWKGRGHPGLSYMASWGTPILELGLARLGPRRSWTGPAKGVSCLRQTAFSHGNYRCPTLIVVRLTIFDFIMVQK